MEGQYMRIDCHPQVTGRINSRQTSQLCCINFQMLAKAYSWVCCDPAPSFPEPYTFSFGRQPSPTAPSPFQSNQIRTTKFNCINFLPKSIVSQYQRLANIYFLMVAIISTIPDVTPLNPALIWTPLLLVLFISIAKELYEDYSRYKTDKEVNESKEVTVLRGGKLQKIKWKQVQVGDLCRIGEQEMFPADVLLISSSNRDGIAYIETSSLDGEQTSKIRYAFQDLNQHYRDDNIAQLAGRFEGEAPSPSLAHFRATLDIDGKALQVSDSSQLLFRGSRLKNTNWIWGVVVYTGQCSKIMMNGQSFVTKLSAVERKLNYLLIALLLCQLAACAVVAALSTAKEMSMRESQHYLLWRSYSQSRLFVMNFLLFFIEYSSCIPVSLIVSIEIVKTAQSYFIDFDQLMFSTWRKRKAYARTAALNEELGQVEYVFCDKTGTITKNELKFHTAVIGDEPYEFKHSEGKYHSRKLSDAMQRRESETRFLEKELVMSCGDKEKEIANSTELIDEYLMCLLLCNNVNTIQDEGALRFESESPDELALIEMAQQVGYCFLRRDKESVSVRIGEEEHRIQVVARFAFSSDRKRMSVLVRWRGAYLLYVKGADNVIFERAAPSPFHLPASIDALSRNGLRSLLIAARIVSDRDVQEFIKDLAMASLSERQLVMEQYAASLQKNLTILGATGLLDELQDDVPQTLRDLQRANIKVWMLTGDKLETAVEIGKACGLVEQEYEVVVMRPNSLPICEYIADCEAKVSSTLKKYCLVVEGAVLAQVFANEEAEQQFAQLTLHFASLVCCRMLPSQKSLAVRMVKGRLGKVCLSVGDGGNDVSMIKEAHIGVGIYGEEGMNAVQASDYALPEFKMLWRLLFVHGRWNYMRISEMILYFTYKSLLFTVPRFLFSFKNAFSGQPIYDDYYIALYNVVFTALPLIVRALFEQDVNYVTKASEEEPAAIPDHENSEAARLPAGYRIHSGVKRRLPRLYFIGQDNEIFNVREILLWLVEAVLVGVCLFFVAERVLGNLSISSSGYGSSLQIVSITIYTAVIMLDTVKLAIQVRHWTRLLFFTIFFLSIAPYLCFIWVLNYKFKRPVQGVLNVYFTSLKTYFVILLLIMVLLAINGLMIYLRFHSQRVLRQLTLALQQDRHISSETSENDQRKQPESEGMIKLKSNKVLDNKLEQ